MYGLDDDDDNFNVDEALGVEEGGRVLSLACVDDVVDVTRIDISGTGDA